MVLSGFADVSAGGNNSAFRMILSSEKDSDSGERF